MYAYLDVPFRDASDHAAHMQMYLPGLGKWKNMELHLYMS